MRLSASDPNADANPLSFPDFLMALGEGRAPCDRQAQIVLPSPIYIEFDVSRFGRAIFLGNETKYMLDEWLTSRAIPKTKNAELLEINVIVRTYIPAEIKTYTSTGTVESENESALRYPVEKKTHLLMVQLSRTISSVLREGFMLTLLHNLDPKNGHENSPRYIAEQVKQCCAPASLN